MGLSRHYTRPQELKQVDHQHKLVQLMEVEPVEVELVERQQQQKE